MNELQKESKKVERLPIVDDYVFKRIFSYEGNEDVLKDLLEAILNIKIKKVKVKNPYLLKTYKDEKESILDIKVEADDNKVIDVEIQTKDNSNLGERGLTYLSKLIAEQAKVGQDYNALKNTIVIFILNENHYKRNSYHSIGRLKFDETTKEAYVDMGYEKEDEVVSPNAQVHIIELKKFNKKKPNMESKINQWMCLLSGGEDEIKMAEEKNEKLKKAVETWDKISLDPEEREIYESIQLQKFLQRISEKNSFDSGKAEGKAEGEKLRRRKRKTRNAIRNCKKITKEKYTNRGD